MTDINPHRAARLSELSELPTLSPLVLCAPNTALDPKTNCADKKIPGLILAYLKKHVSRSVWLDHLVLFVLISMARNRDESSIYGQLSLVHKRLVGFSRARGSRFDNIVAFNANVDQIMRLYLSRIVLIKDSSATRHNFYTRYQTMAELSRDWLMSMPAAERSKYTPLLFSGATPALHGHLLDYKRVEQEQKANRKAEVDALMPVYPEIRREAHMRFNQITRLKEAYDEFLSFHVPDSSGPLRLSFLDKGLRFEFLVWDQKNFLDSIDLKKGSGSIPPHILHLKRIVRVSDGVEIDIPEELWFHDVIRRGVTRTGLAPEDLQWLRSWGYANTGFQVTQTGILSWSSPTLMHLAQRKVDGFLIPINELYIAASFGLLAIDLFTTTGIRLNEALQISLDKECFVRLEMPAAPGATSRSPTIRYSLRVVPKGEKTNRRADNFISDETKRLLVKVAKTLSQHYSLSEIGTLPIVSFVPSNRRAHRFGPARYIFQLNNVHMSGVTLSSCVRLMMHGMDVRMADGRAIAVRPHLLRHGFATHAVQVEKIPVDIVGRWLHQKSVEVTGYYSEPTETMVADASDRYLATIASHLNVDEEVERSPAELKELYEDAIGKTGTLALVVGGSCGSHGFCRAQLACIGCAAKVPDPAKRDQVLHQRNWAVQEIKFYRNEGLMPAARRLEILVKNADAELREMDQIEEYRADECIKGVIEVDDRA